MTGMTAGLDLTAFQKKNREKSIYRGMELFLEYKDNSTPDMPVYCPVLYDRSTTLDNYASILDRPVTSADRETPVVEVINLLAAIPVARRFVPEIAILKQKIHQGIVKKAMRKSAEFTLIEDVRRHAHAAKPGNAEDPYGHVDKRADRQVTLEANNKPGTADSAPIRKIGGSLEGRPVAVDPMTLKTFAMFRELDHDKLEALAAQCLVYQVPPGTQLLERGTSDAWSLYLIEGTVRLMAADGVAKFIEGGTDKATSPISSLKPRVYTVTAVTHVSFLRAEDRMVEEIVRGTTPARRDAMT